MVQPINYMAMMPQEDFLQSIQGGLQLGLSLRDARMRQQQQEAALQRQAQYRTDVVEAMKAPTPQTFAALAIKYPEQREAFKQSWETLSEGDRKDQGAAMAQAYSAALAGRNDLVQELLTKRIEARKNSGIDYSAEDGLLQIARDNPDQLKASLGLALSFISDPKDFAAKFGALGGEQRAQEQAPADLRKKNADATTAEVAAQNAPQNAILDLQKKGWDIKKLQSDIDINKQDSRIAAMNAAIAREGNDLKRQELQLRVNEAITARDTKLRDKVTEVESARLNMDNMLNTADRILNNKSLNDVLGSIEGRLPAVLSDEAADAVALIETLKSQSFLAQIPNIKGMGALSNAEGEKLQAALQNLDRVQSEPQFRASVKEAQRLILKARKNVADRYGVPESVPDTPAASASPSEIDDLVRRYTAGR